ncbi:DNA repair protein rad18, partial [Tuber magnatum]
MSQPYLSIHNQKIIDVTDPSDWNTTRLPVLKSLDSALRCQICKDYYHTPVMTGCCHTFCSECIRRSLVREQKCPVCRATAQESQLRKNGAAQELVDAFRAARPLLMEVAGENVEKRRVSTGGVEDGTEDEGDGYPDLGEGGGRKRRRRRRGRIDDGGAPDGSMKSAGGRRITRGSTSGLVACPICGEFMKEIRVDSHIERGCPKESPASPRKTPPRRTPYPTPTNPPDLIPKKAFNMMKESVLRNKLHDLGIPSHGNKRTLQDRYNEWMTLWNANLDSTMPKSKKELLKELSAWDSANRVPVVEKTKAAGWTDEGWSESNKSHYNELIARAKAPRVKPE